MTKLASIKTIQEVAYVAKRSRGGASESADSLTELARIRQMQLDNIVHSHFLGRLLWSKNSKLVEMFSLESQETRYPNEKGCA
jgi:hypothetical protein